MIEINVKEQGPRPQLFKPSAFWGLRHGVVCQQYVDGEPQKEFLVGAGHNERPICIWWDNENSKYRISSESKKELRAFLPHVRYAIVKADVNITLKVR